MQCCKCQHHGVIVRSHKKGYFLRDQVRSYGCLPALLVLGIGCLVGRLGLAAGVCCHGHSIKVHAHCGQCWLTLFSLVGWWVFCCVHN
jgi:hypothetical protein